MRTRHARWIAAFALLAAPTLAGQAAATEEATLTEPAAEAAMEETTMGAGHVARAAFTTMVADREPQDDVTQLTNETSRIIFFTDLRGLNGRTVSHVWEKDGMEMARVPFVVGGERWRVYSTKNLEPSWTGEWTVKILDEDGNVLQTRGFTYLSVSTDDTGMQETAPASMPME